MKNKTALKISVVAGLLMASIFAHASPPDNAWLEVHVKDRHSEKPLADAAVCLGTTGVSDQFGARRTDKNGIVRFDDVMRTSLQVTVSKSGFQSTRRLLEPLNASRVLELKIVTGGGGPECVAPDKAATPEAASASLLIKSATVERDVQSVDNRVLVSVTANATANQVRISENADFSGANWVELTTPVAVALSDGRGAKYLFIQVRRHSGTEGASLNVVSPVKKLFYQAH